MPSVVDTDFDDNMVTANDIHSETSNDDCLSQSPLNLTRSQGLLSSIHTFINIQLKIILLLFMYVYTYLTL